MNRRAIIMGDLYRGRAVTYANVARLYGILRDPLAAAGVDLYRYQNEFRGCWVKRYDAAPSVALLEALRRDLQTDDIVFCFETPPVMARAFAALDIKFFDLNIHPIRFGPDLLLGVRAWDCAANTRLESYHADVERMTRTYPARPVNMPELEGVPIFFAQCEGDRTLISQGRMIEWRHARGAVKAYAAGGPWYVKPHPSEPENCFVRGALRAGARLLPDEINTYDLLASRILFKPFALSSSVLFEAQAFGYRARPLLALNNFGTPVLHDFRRSAFWADILGIPFPPGSHSSDFEPGYLRREFGAWSFRESA